MAPKISFHKETDFKETPIGKIPSEWRIVTLGDVVKYTKGTKPKTPVVEKEEGALPYLTADVMRTGDFTRWSKKSEDLVRVSKDDVILIWDGFYCGDTFTGFDGILSSTMIRIDPEMNLDRRFLFYLLKTHFKELNTKVSGMYLKHVSKSVFEGLKLPLPFPEEQQRVVEVLSLVDDTIQKTNEVIAKTERLKKGLMQELLTKGIRHKEFKDTEIGTIPKDWKVVGLGKIATEVYRYPTYYNIAYEDSGIPEVRGELINENGELEEDLSKYRFISKETSERFPRTVLLEGDFVLSVRGTMGKVAIIPKSLKGANITANLMRISLDRSRCYPPFFKQVFLSDSFKRTLQNLSSQTTIKTIQAPVLKSIEVPLPPLSEQEKVAETLSTVDKKLELERDEKAKLERIKQGMMDLLLTGKIRVKVN